MSLASLRPLRCNTVTSCLFSWQSLTRTEILKRASENFKSGKGAETFCHPLYFYDFSTRGDHTLSFTPYLY